MKITLDFSSHPTFLAKDTFIPAKPARQPLGIRIRQFLQKMKNKKENTSTSMSLRLGFRRGRQNMVDKLESFLPGPTC